MLLSGSMGGFVGFAGWTFLKVCLMAILSCSRWTMSSPSPVVVATTSQTYVPPTEDVTMREGHHQYEDYEPPEYGVPTAHSFVNVVYRNAKASSTSSARVERCKGKVDIETKSIFEIALATVEQADAIAMCDYLEDLGEMLWPTVQGMSC